MGRFYRPGILPFPPWNASLPAQYRILVHIALNGTGHNEIYNLMIFTYVYTTTWVKILSITPKMSFMPLPVKAIPTGGNHYFDFYDHQLVLPFLEICVRNHQHNLFLIWFLLFSNVCLQESCMFLYVPVPFSLSFIYLSTIHRERENYTVQYVIW